MGDIEHSGEAPADYNGLSRESFLYGNRVLDRWEALTPEMRIELVPHLIDRIVTTVYSDGATAEQASEVSEVLDSLSEGLDRFASGIAARESLDPSAQPYSHTA